jgi:O-methyltransferase
MSDKIYETFKDYTMIPREVFLLNLELINDNRHIEGVIVECGTWKGGMIAGIAKMLSPQERKYYLFDSFDGLPAAEKIDGDAANKWQSDKEAKNYFNNCKADQAEAERAMEISGANDYIIKKGWFENTLSLLPTHEKIAVLRLDADWYKSTKVCLDSLYDRVVTGGIVIIDDYYTWDGCATAVHDFLSSRNLSDRIYQYNNIVAYIVKK